MTAKERAIRERLRELECEDGSLDLDAVIESAKNPDDPMHSEFTWDVSKAAQERWRDQARALIRSVKYIEKTTQLELHCPNYVHITRPLGKTGYISMDSVKSSKDISLDVLNEEVRRARSTLERARAIADELQMRGPLEEAIARIVRLQKEIL